MVAGHTLVVPKVEVDVFFDLPTEILHDIMPFCQTVSEALKRVISCNRVGITVMGLEVPHAHIHLMPMNAMRDMSFEKPPLDIPKEEMVKLAGLINHTWTERSHPTTS